MRRLGPCARSACTTRAAASSSRSSRATPAASAIYACGPTVYNRIHVGNARPYVVFSLLKRFLEHEGYDVTLVANVTDVNDKIYDAARAAGGPERRSSAREMTAAYVADTDGLGLGRPDHEPLASETIGQIVELIQALIDSGSAYAVEGDVYFRVRSDPRYGELSHRSVDDDGPGRGRRGRRSSRRTRSTSRSGRRRRRARTPPGTRPGAAAGRAGTSSARRWPRSCSASASTSTAAATT